MEVWRKSSLLRGEAQHIKAIKSTCWIETQGLNVVNFSYVGCLELLSFKTSMDEKYFLTAGKDSWTNWFSKLEDKWVYH